MLNTAATLKDNAKLLNGTFFNSLCKNKQYGIMRPIIAMAFFLLIVQKTRRKCVKVLFRLTV